MTKKYTDIVIDRVTYIMKRKEITITQLAKRLDISSQTLGQYLSKKRTMPFEVGIMIAIELHIDLSALYHITEHPLYHEEYVEYLKIRELFHK